MITGLTEIKINNLGVKIYKTRLLMGMGAAYDVTKKIKELLSKQHFVNIIFAAAPSQNEFLSLLSQQKELDWDRVNAFHMDEYLGLDENNPARFGNFLKERIFGKIPFHEVHYLNGTMADPQTECKRYSNLLRKYSTDIVCMGIGENGHLAFNDPHSANFDDTLMVKVVNLAVASRRQQVDDDCFRRIEDVPTSAITLTIPALLQAKFIYCIVPGSNKAQALYHTIYSELKESYPSTSLRKHANATLYTDKNSSLKL